MGSGLLRRGLTLRAWQGEGFEDTDKFKQLSSAANKRMADTPTLETCHLRSKIPRLELPAPAIPPRLSRALIWDWRKVESPLVVCAWCCGVWRSRCVVARRARRHACALVLKLASLIR